ncbi:transglycosylase SLT domain-containing protein [Streptomyces liangshanensis]|uniref:Transglycosylase SLT domain-containing protein n=1 Tax=Streptomyces liangshanensis TaxID=2717324 RepID=A0A6G9GVW7_9ACTN|nr:LysM peptidoglycan-binding domain-containing protein [Streptomyces liangshanensis]QIQ02151.1 transglycosylase SLT domain-containing protein [Streptomyces liangshanensis]
MPIKGKHRRSRFSPLARRLVAVGTGSVALALPLVAAHTASAATGTSAAVTAEKKSVTTYSVVAGDSLAKIARTHSLSGGWKTLYQDNRAAVGANPSVIRPGLKLTLGGRATAPAATKAKPATGTTIAVQTAAKTYSNNLDGWIRESLDVMAAHHIPGTYNGIYRNIMRESSGNPNAINNWDSNAAAGIPSKGLLQVIDPTFRAYHVPGTSMNSYDPVANITAACNYAAAKYGSIDNVNGPY